MLLDDFKLPKEIINYINSYPAFKGHSGIINDRFWEWGFSDIEIKAERDSDKSNPIYKFCKSIWGSYDYHNATMTDAKEFLQWIEPAWCAYKRISSTEFFDPELETFGEDDLLDI